MKKSDLFNANSICIFTDSSFKRYNYCPQNQAYGVTAPAYCVYYNDLLIDQGFEILHNSTSQQGELQALLLGIRAAAKYKQQFRDIRLFSDNQNAIFATRERIFQWVEESIAGKNTLGDDGRISNQSYIMSIICTILDNGIYLQLYHIKGHVKNNKKSLQEAHDLFVRSNPFVGNDVNFDLIEQLAIGNDIVDRYSTAMLQLYLKDSNLYKDTKSIFTFGYAPFDVVKYASLVNRGGNRPQK